MTENHIENSHTNSASAPLLAATNLHKKYRNGNQNLHILRGINVQVNQGECLAILGKSGSGKSTLLHLLGGLDKPDDGQVRFSNDDIFKLRGAALDKYRNKHIGFVFQFYHLLPELTALENVMVGSMIGGSIFSWPARRAKVKKRAQELLNDMGLSGRTKHKPAKLSGGERQRVAIARALINEPEILLADEPTGNLDSATSGGVMKLFDNLRHRGQTMVLVTHDQQIAARASRSLRLVDGQLG